MTTDDRFEVLLAGLLDGSPTPAEREELLEAVAGSPERARRLIDLLRFEPLLLDCAQGEEGGEGFVRRVQQAALRQQEEAEVERFTRGILGRLRQRSPAAAKTRPPLAATRKLLPRHLAAAALLVALVCGGLFVAWPSRERPAPGARLEAVQGEVYVVSGDDRSSPAVTGQQLLPGQTVRTVGEDSTATVRFPDATRLELRLNASLRVDQRDAGLGVVLSEGSLTAELPQPAAGRPMVVSTPLAEVTPSGPAGAGARFRLSNAPGSMHVELERGSVAVRRKSDGVSIRLKKGECALIAARGEPPVPWQRPPRLTAPATALGRHGGRITSLEFSPDGKTLASGDVGGVIRLWDPAARRQRGDPLAARAQIASAFFSPDGRTLAVVVPVPDAGARGGAVVELWGLSARASKMGQGLPAVAQGQGRTAVFSPDGRLLASVDAGRNIHVWDVATRERKATFRTRKGRILCLAFSPDGQALTAADEYALATTWPLAGGRPHAVRLEAYQGDRFCAAFSPDKKRFATGTKSGTAQVWEADSGKLLATLHGHRGAVYCLAFSADGSLLATGSRDGTTRLWDVTTGRELATLDGGPVYVQSVAFSLDGKTLAIGSSDGTVKVWDVGTLRRGLDGVRLGKRAGASDCPEPIG